MVGALPEVVRVQRLELVDAEGRVRARLALNEEGCPGLMLVDEGGHVRASLNLGKEGIPHLTLLNKSGLVRASLGFGTDWHVALELSDGNSQIVWSAP